MKTHVQFSSAILATVLCIITTTSVIAQNDEGAIKYRQSIMKSVGGHTGAIYEIVKNSNPNGIHLNSHARALEDLMGMVSAAFQTRTSGGKTRAKAEIWTDPTGFKAASDDSQAAAGEFAAAVESGNEAKIDMKLDALLDSCKGCHREYRERKE